MTGPQQTNLHWIKWATAVFIALDILIIYRFIHRILLRGEHIPPDAPLFFLLIIGVQILLFTAFRDLKLVTARNQQLYVNYETELSLARQIADGVAVPVGVLDEHGRYVYANPACAEFLGLPVKELLGRNSLEFLEALDGRPLSAKSVKELQVEINNQPYVYDVVLRRANGEAMRVNVYSTPRWHAGRLVGVITSVLPHDEAFIAQGRELASAQRESGSPEQDK